MKHNNVVANAHFHKWWQRYVKTWFDQPAKKLKRRQLRKEKAAAIAPRPLNLLRPVVRCQTAKYNSKIREGRGFSLDELAAAGISRKAALGVGIAVDHRRKNRSEDAFQQNVARLKLYKSKLVIFPRNPTSKRAKKTDSSAEERKRATQVTVPEVLALPGPANRFKARAITKAERERNVAATLRKARTDAKLWGAREKRLKDKKDAKPEDKKADE